MEYVIESSSLKNKIKKDFESYKTKIEKVQNEIIEKIDSTNLDLNIKESLLGFEEYLLEKKKIREVLLQYENELEKTKEDLKHLKSDFMASLYDEIITTLEIISEEENIDIILSHRSSVIYGKNSVDFSQRAIDLLNELNSRETPTAK